MPRISRANHAQPLNARTLRYWSDRLSAPAYDRDLVRPGVVHFGVGGFHRAHQGTPRSAGAASPYRYASSTPNSPKSAAEADQPTSRVLSLV